MIGYVAIPFSPQQNEAQREALGFFRMQCVVSLLT